MHGVGKGGSRRPLCGDARRVGPVIIPAGASTNGHDAQDKSATNDGEPSKIRSRWSSYLMFAN